MIYEATKRFTWEGAHQLSDSHHPECQRTHGHGYKMEVTIGSKHLDRRGMVIDFKILNEIVNPIVDRYDHALITVENFGENPTAENMAVRIYNEVTFALDKRMHDSGLICTKIRIWETENCSVTVRAPQEVWDDVCS